MSFYKADWPKLPFHVDCTSYIIPDDILPNAHFLKDKIEDIELVLFEVDEDTSNIPNQKIIDELNQVTRKNDLSYTVHLPLDLRLSDDPHQEHAYQQNW